MMTPQASTAWFSPSLSVCSRPICEYCILWMWNVNVSPSVWLTSILLPCTSTKGQIQSLSIRSEHSLQRLHQRCQREGWRTEYLHFVFDDMMPNFGGRWHCRYSVPGLNRWHVGSLFQESFDRYFHCQWGVTRSVRYRTACRHGQVHKMPILCHQFKDSMSSLGAPGEWNTTITRNTVDTGCSAAEIRHHKTMYTKVSFQLNTKTLQVTCIFNYSSNYWCYRTQSWRETD